MVSSEMSVVLWSLVAPTVMTLRELHGLVMVTRPERPMLPAAQTTTTPASQSESTACTRGSVASDSLIGWPSDRFTTRMPYSVLWSWTHCSPARTSEACP